eukprot:5650087-Pleurochrysis_carterae.AAC.1
MSAPPSRHLISQLNRCSRPYANFRIGLSLRLASIFGRWARRRDDSRTFRCAMTVAGGPGPLSRPQRLSRRFGARPRGSRGGEFRQRCMLRAVQFVTCACELQAALPMYRRFLRFKGAL